MTTWKLECIVEAEDDMSKLDVLNKIHTDANRGEGLYIATVYASKGQRPKLKLLKIEPDED